MNLNLNKILVFVLHEYSYKYDKFVPCLHVYVLMN